jgi:hypothetical protein
MCFCGVFSLYLCVQNHLVEMDAKKAPAPTWETVRYMISCIQYGGRITDDFDQLLMDTFAEKYFHQGVLQVNTHDSSPLSCKHLCVCTSNTAHTTVHLAHYVAVWPGHTRFMHPDTFINAKLTP